MKTSQLYFMFLPPVLYKGKAFIIWQPQETLWSIDRQYVQLAAVAMQLLIAISLYVKLVVICQDHTDLRSLY